MAQALQTKHSSRFPIVFHRYSISLLNVPSRLGRSVHKHRPTREESFQSRTELRRAFRRAGGAAADAAAASFRRSLALLALSLSQQRALLLVSRPKRLSHEEEEWTHPAVAIGAPVLFQ